MRPSKVPEFKGTPLTYTKSITLSRGGLFESTRDENSINFQTWGNNNKKFGEAKGIIEERIHKNNKPSENRSLDGLEKLAELKEKEVITEVEFQEKKKQILEL